MEVSHGRPNHRNRDPRPLPRARPGSGARRGDAAGAAPGRSARGRGGQRDGPRRRRDEGRPPRHRSDPGRVRRPRRQEGRPDRLLRPRGGGDGPRSRPRDRLAGPGSRHPSQRRGGNLCSPPVPRLFRRRAAPPAGPQAGPRGAPGLHDPALPLRPGLDRLLQRGDPGPRPLHEQQGGPPRRPLEARVARAPGARPRVGVPADRARAPDLARPVPGQPHPQLVDRGGPPRAMGPPTSSATGRPRRPTASDGPCGSSPGACRPSPHGRESGRSSS